MRKLILAGGFGIILFLSACAIPGINQGDPKLDPWKQLDFQCGIFAETIEFITFQNITKKFSKVESRRMLNIARIISPICKGEMVIVDVKKVLKIVEDQLKYLIIMKASRTI